MACNIPDSLWGALAGALFGGLIASGIVAHLTQKWIEKRERSIRRDDLRLECYFEVIDMIIDNERELAECDSNGETASMELQAKRTRISHRLKLLASNTVCKSYKDYTKLVYSITDHPASCRSTTSNDVEHARNQLIELMGKDV